MENGQESQVPFNVLSDTYHVWVPIEDHDLLKSVEVDENGDYIVQGVMTSDDKDEEDDSINPDGMDCSYFLTKGWIKYEHGNNPNQFIGEPLEVRVGQFTHPKTQESVNGILVKGRLFAQRELTKAAVRAIEDLQKSNTKRCMGWSIEGNVKERCRKTGKVLKSVLRNVVLTMNPVNTTTWAELAKSFAKNHEVEVDMELDKSMGTAEIAEVMPQSIEGTKVQAAPGDEKDTKAKKLFRKFLKDTLLVKSTRKQFTTSTAGEAGLGAYTHAKQNGLDYDEACEFASYIAERHDLLKSLIGKFGGGKMSQEQKSSLAEMLDTDLEELQKSLEVDTDEEDELEKAVNTDEDESGEESGEDESDSDESDDEEDSDEEDESDNEDGSEDDEEDEEVEKSIGSELRKSLADEHGQAFEVSDFLTSLVDEVGFGMEGLQKSMTNMTKQQTVIVKSLTSMVQVVQDMVQKVEGLESENAELRKSLNDVLERPVGRKSVVNQREVQTLQKSMGSEQGGKPLTRQVIGDILMKSFESGELNGSEVARFEGGVPLDRLNLPSAVKQKLGLA